LHPSKSVPMLYLLLVSMRPSQWIKNTFIFAALIFAHKLFDGSLVLRSLAAFGLFCLLSSSVYLINDVCDRAEDRRHPEKCKRPIASGALPVGVVVPLIVLLTVFSLGTSFLLNTALGCVATAYFGLNLLYSLRLKHVVILDVMLIGIGFVL